MANQLSPEGTMEFSRWRKPPESFVSDSGPGWARAATLLFSRFRRPCRGESWRGRVPVAFATPLRAPLHGAWRGCLRVGRWVSRPRTRPPRETEFRFQERVQIEFGHEERSLLETGNKIVRSTQEPPSLIQLAIAHPVGMTNSHEHRNHFQPGRARYPRLRARS